MEENVAIKFENLKFSYTKNDDYVLKGIDLKIFRGQIIGYIGSNGAGKTTTIKLILNLLSDYSGKIEVLGKDISVDKVNYKYNIGYVPENGYLYENLTGSEFLNFLGRIYKINKNKLPEKITNLASLMGIADNIDQRIFSYSKGMKQKLLIISALLHNPDIIFLDEPLNGLDANSIQIFKKVLTLLAKDGKTIFYSSHIMDVVEKISDRIILLNNGKVIADGTFEEIKKKSKSGTLEVAFGKLTGNEEFSDVAKDFITVIKD